MCAGERTRELAPRWSRARLGRQMCCRSRKPNCYTAQNTTGVDKTRADGEKASTKTNKRIIYEMYTSTWYNAVAVYTHVCTYMVARWRRSVCTRKHSTAWAWWKKITKCSFQTGFRRRVCPRRIPRRRSLKSTRDLINPCARFCTISYCINNIVCSRSPQTSF